MPVRAKRFVASNAEVNCTSPFRPADAPPALLPVTGLTPKLKQSHAGAPVGLSSKRVYTWLTVRPAPHVNLEEDNHMRPKHVPPSSPVADNVYLAEPKTGTGHGVLREGCGLRAFVNKHSALQTPR